MTAPPDLGGRVGMVTGASRGIGRAIAIGMAAAGMDVVGIARNRSDLDLVGDAVEAAGARFMPIAADVADVDAAPTHARLAWEWQGRVDGLVNAAGITDRADALVVTPETWDRLFAVNVRGCFFLTRAVAGRMLEAAGGSIVNIASVSGVVSDGAQAPYSATKGALINLTTVLADQWGPTVRVNAVSPGWVATDMTADYLARPGSIDHVADRTPLERVADPSEMVGPALFLLSEASSYVTGQNLLVDGGWTVR